MKITGFNPLIVTAKADDVVKVFEDLGFEKSHTKTGVDQMNVTSIRMKDANGNHVDIGDTPVPQDMTVIRMNVDDFDEAFELLTSNGFKNPRGDSITETPTSKSAFLVSPSGFAIDLVKHLK